MKKPIILSVFFFIITAISSFGQGVWIEEKFGPIPQIDNGIEFRTGKFEIHGKVYEIKPNANLAGADLSGADLSKASLEGSDLAGANLENAKLNNAYFGSAILKGAKLKGADLSEATLEFADVQYADFRETNLKNTSLMEVNWIGTNFFGANFEKTLLILDEDPQPRLSRLLSSISMNIESINEIKNAIFIEGSSIIPALLFNDQEQRNSITANTTKIDELDGILSSADETLEAFSQNLDVLNENDQSIGEQLTTLGQNDISIGEQMTTLGENDQSISEQMATLSENDQSIMAEINAMKAQLQTLVASVAEKDAQIAEKDAKIAELEQGGGGQSLEQVLEQVRDARAGSVVLTVDPEGDNITLGLIIEQSDNLTEWTKLDGEMTRTIPIPDGKKFYRFALDK